MLKIKLTEFLILDRYSTGSVICKDKIKDVNILVELSKKEDKIDTNIQEVVEKPKISLKEIDDRLLTIDDFL